jgi:hypothetical protein
MVFHMLYISLKNAQTNENRSGEVKKFRARDNLSPMNTYYVAEKNEFGAEEHRHLRQKSIEFGTETRRISCCLVLLLSLIDIIERGKR